MAQVHHCRTCDDLDGYVGQFYESYRVSPGVEMAPFWIWGAISTVFYLYLLLGGRPDGGGRQAGAAGEGARPIVLAWRILLVSWILYPVGYAIPAIFPTDDWIVVRQICYTVADITSKLVFGIVLARAALIMSAEEGYGEAIETRSPRRVRERA